MFLFALISRRLLAYPFTLTCGILLFWVLLFFCLAGITATTFELISWRVEQMFLFLSLLFFSASVELISCCFLLCSQAMASVTVETATVLLVGMETDVNSSVTSAPGRAGGGARLQTAKSAATEVCLLQPGHRPGAGSYLNPNFILIIPLTKSFVKTGSNYWCKWI